MKVAIVGSRGIPNRYGGFEELAEKLAIGLGEKGHSIIVYNPHNHPVPGFKATGVSIIKIFDPEFLLGTFGQFLYDLGATLHTWVARPDIILQLGYTSSSIWYRFLPRTSRIITNMDGFEWMRSKYNKPVKKFLKLAEKWAAKQSHLLIADHLEIETYLQNNYVNQVIFVPYGAEVPKEKTPELLAQFNLQQKKYNLLIARFEPENHIEEIINGHKISGIDCPLVLVGSYSNGYGKNLYAQNQGNKNIIFLGPIYDKQTLNALRSHAHLYFHGHSVGGTNPSLLEAMACGCNIVAHKNPYNKGVLGNHALYFLSPEDIAQHLQARFIKSTWQGRARKNISAIRDKYNWQIVIEQYELAMKQLLI